MKKIIMLVTIVLAFVIMPHLSVKAQEIKIERIAKPVGFRVTENLRDVKPIPPGSLDEDWSKKTIPNSKFVDDELRHTPPVTEPDPTLQDWFGGKRASSPSPIIQKNIPGLDHNTQPGTSVPPDTQGDVGPNHYIQNVNAAFAVYDKEGEIVYGPADLITVWDGFTGPWSSTNDGDPIVLYDEYADRWLISQFSLPNGQFTAPYYELIAISQTSDPTGAWYQYAYEYDRMPDYPKLGIWQDGYYMTTHMFSNGQNFFGAFVSAFDRDAMLVGDPDAATIDFNLGNQNFGLLCADADGTMPPADGEPQYVLDVRTNSLKVYKIEVDWENPGNSRVSTMATIGVQSFNSNVIISQKGVNEKLESNSINTMYRLQYRNFGDYEVMVTNHTINVGGSRAGVRWYELRKEDGGNWYVYQQGTYAPADGNGRFMGSIAMNQNGDLALGYSVTGADYPSIRFTGQSAGAPDGLGIMDIEETEILAGQASQVADERNRWGDYSMMSIDPSNGQTFWYTQQYSKGGWNWATQFAAFDFVQVPQAEFSSDEIIIPTGGTVNFFDQTTGIPEEWQWKFDGGMPQIKTNQNPEGIKYNTEGVYKVTLEATNVLGSDTEVKEDYITVSSTILPEINFESDKDFVCVGEEVSFTDMTIYSPNQWQWTFNPSTVTFVNGTDATSQNPEVVFEEAASYSVTLESWNLNGSTTKTETDYILSGGYEPYYLETFEEGSLRSQNWTVVNPDNGITWGLYEVGGTTPGKMAVGIDFSNYTSITERDRLISPSFNLEGLGIASLEFQYAYAQRHNNLTDSLIVYVSADCGNSWTRVYANGEDGDGSFATHEFTDGFWPTEASDWCMAGWGARCVTISLTPWAGMSNIQVAFESFNSYGNPMFIDNIAISQTVDVSETMANSEVSVYPNPTNGSFQIVVNEGEKFSKLRIFNHIGQMVYEEDIKPNNHVIEITPKADWNAGVYTMEVSNFGKTVTKKVVLF